MVFLGASKRPHVPAPVSPAADVFFPVLALVLADHPDDVFKVQGPNDFLQTRLFLRIAPDPCPNFFQEFFPLRGRILPLPLPAGIPHGQSGLPPLHSAGIALVPALRVQNGIRRPPDAATTDLCLGDSSDTSSPGSSTAASSRSLTISAVAPCSLHPTRSARRAFLSSPYLRMRTGLRCRYQHHLGATRVELD